MIRTLFLIAAASFVLAVACLSGAAAIGGRELLHRRWPDNWTVHIRDDDGGSVTISPRGDEDAASGPTATREIAWTGGDSLYVDLPADVQFAAGAGPGKIIVTGPKGAVDRVALSGSHLELTDEDGGGGRVSVALTAPAVRRFVLNGDQNLSLKGVNQDELDLDVSGHAIANAVGKVRAAKVDISGDGDVDLAKLAAQDAHVEISGAGRARVAPAASADLRISGSGEIDLLSRPPSLSSEVSGAGRIVQKPATSPPG